MSKLTIVLALFGFDLMGGTSAFAGHKFFITGTFELAGSCDGQDRQHFEASNKSVTGLAIVTIHQANGQDVSPMVSTGPNDDGAGGCNLFKSILDCRSMKGQFEIDDGDDGYIHTWWNVGEFRCL